VLYHRVPLPTTVALLLAGLLLAAALPGCERSSPESEQPEQLGFAVADSLLGPEVVIEEAGKALRPPRAFRAVSDSLLQTLRTSELAALQDPQTSLGASASNVELVAAFLDSARHAGLVVFVRRGFAAGDGESAAAYEDALREGHANAEIRSGDYAVNDVYVRNFLVSDASLIKFLLLCFSEGHETMELVYFSSRSHYPELVRAFESSIGTVRVAGKGG
jgi:hypothetical protein